MQSFTDDQTICLMVLNKSSDILQNHRVMSDGPMTFREHCSGIHWFSVNMGPIV